MIQLLSIVMPNSLNLYPQNLVVGNKIDLPRREVDQKLAQGFVKNHNMAGYIETSAKTRQGVVRKEREREEEGGVYLTVYKFWDWFTVNLQYSHSCVSSLHFLYRMMLFIL